jgi:hypothetical protein
MLQLTTPERLALFVIQQSNNPLESYDIGRRTGPLNELLEVLERLQKLDLIRKSTCEGRSVYEAVPVTESPALSYIGWLKLFTDAMPQYVVGDNLATTYASCGVVFLVAVLLGTKDVTTIAGVTTLTTEFVELVLDLADENDFFWCPALYDLRSELLEHTTDFELVEDRLHCIKELFWDFVWSVKTENILEAARAGRHFQGIDWWVDEELEVTETNPVGD